MAGISLQHPNFAQAALVWSATLAALLLLAAVLAYWTWAWLAPQPVPRARAVEAPPRLDAAYRLFGGTQRNRNAVAPTGLAVRLLGVAAASGGKSGYAIVQLEAGSTIAVREGMDIAPGIRLAQVQAEQIVLERNGVRETLALPESRAREAGAPPQQHKPAERPAPRSRMDQR